jgi:hypothetical protein
MISHIAYGGWADNIRLANDSMELVITRSVGPRVIRLAPLGGRNLFKEFPEQLGGTGEAEWMIRGGHRLWHAPEAKPRSYALDNSPVPCEILNDFSVRLTPAAEGENGVQKTLEFSLAAERAEVSVVHTLTNTGPWTIELAPWALTVMAPGGTAIIPLPEKQSHTDVLVPDFPLVLWPYTDMRDPRYGWGRRYLTFSQDPQRGPGKFGLPVALGWVAYQLDDLLFVKYFDYDPSARYPDYGCNFETFSNEEMLEVESLGPMTLLAPGESVEHVETWRLFTGVPACTTEDELDREILARATPR